MGGKKKGELEIKAFSATLEKPKGKMTELPSIMFTELFLNRFFFNFVRNKSFLCLF